LGFCPLFIEILKFVQWRVEIGWFGQSFLHGTFN
jgi:hypothetical protein